jgi:hydroxymethylglutaryl-CoA synthase
MNNNKSVGIVGYGAYVPHCFLDPAQINPVAKSLGLVKKSLAGWDEDSVTMAVSAGKTALGVAGIPASDLGAVYVGSESPPYAVNPMSTIVADVLGVGERYRAVDLQFACKAATAGLQMAMGEVEGKHHNYALVVGADKAQARPGDVLEWSAGAAGAALVVGNQHVLARILRMVSVTSDTPDFWRRGYEQYPKHGGRFTGEPAYFKHVLAASRLILSETELAASHFTHAVFHMPNGRFPVEVAAVLGFKPKQIEVGHTVSEVGNPYAASAMLGLVAVLERLKPGEKVLMTAYGSGAGADAMVLEGTDELLKHRWGGLEALFANRIQVSLSEYQERGRWG